MIYTIGRQQKHLQVGSLIAPLRNNDDFLETHPAPRKSKDNNIEVMGKDIAKMLDFETISNTESQ